MTVYFINWIKDFKIKNIQFLRKYVKNNVIDNNISNYDIIILLWQLIIK